MPTSDDLKSWFELQSATLDRVHPSWFPRIEPKLILAARRNPFGRRWLANYLERIGASLFSLAEWRAAAAARLATVAWLRQPLEEPMECAMELGGVALAAGLRTVVTRDGVMKLRLALGAPRYDRILQFQSSVGEHPPWANESVEEIADHVARRGAMELAGYTENAHPAWGESVRLSFPRDWWSEAPAPWTLPAATIEAALRPPDTLYEVVLTGTDA